MFLSHCKQIIFSKEIITIYCIGLYCIVLYCVVLYCIVLYCIVSYCNFFLRFGRGQSGSDVLSHHPATRWTTCTPRQTLRRFPAASELKAPPRPPVLPRPPHCRWPAMPGLSASPVPTQRCGSGFKSRAMLVFGCGCYVAVMLLSCCCHVAVMLLSCCCHVADLTGVLLLVVFFSPFFLSFLLCCPFENWSLYFIREYGIQDCISIHPAFSGAL